MARLCGQPFSHPQRYNPKPPLSRFFGNFFLAGLQCDAERPLTNRGGIVNFREGISRDLPGISSRRGSYVLDLPGRAVVLPVVFSSFGRCVLDLPLPPPRGGGSGLPDTVCELFLPVSPGFSVGNRLFGTELFVGRSLLSRKSDSQCPLRIAPMPIPSPTFSRLPPRKVPATA